MATRVHGTCVELGGVGILLLGPSGSGKSDLALRVIDCGGALIADDQVSIECVSGCLVAHAPAELRGILEVRGIGLVDLPFSQQTSVSVVFELVKRGEVERMPRSKHWECLGVKVPSYRIDPLSASACAKIRLVADGVRHT